MALSSSQIQHICACGWNPSCQNAKTAKECAQVLANAYGVTIMTIYDLWEMNAKPSRKRTREDFSTASDESVDDMLHEWDQKPWSKELAFTAFVDPFMG